jgi:hypothetical protein
MTDQVQFLNQEPLRFQIGEPGAPAGGTSTCTDTVGTMIVYHEKHLRVSAQAFRYAARPGDSTPWMGLTPSQFLAGLLKFGVRGYSYIPNINASDAIKATDHGIVCLLVGYSGYPSRQEAQVGGRTDFGFAGAHAVSLWGRRTGGSYGINPKSWVCWTRDPDHHYGDTTPPYDRFDTSYLTRAIRALVGANNWRQTAMIAR